MDKKLVLQGSNIYIYIFGKINKSSRNMKTLEKCDTLKTLKIDHCLETMCAIIARKIGDGNARGNSYEPKTRIARYSTIFIKHAIPELLFLEKIL